MLSLVTKSLKILHYENKISKYRVVVILCFKRVGQTILPSFRLQYMTLRHCLRPLIEQVVSSFYIIQFFKTIIKHI